MRRVVFAVVLASAGAAHGQQAPAPPPSQPASPAGGLGGDAADRWLDRQTNYSRLSDDVAGSSRSLRPVPARAEDVVQGSEVHDAKGLVVGTIARVGGGFAVLASELGKVEVDVKSFAKNRNGLLINLPKKKIDAMMSGGKPAG